MAIRTYGPTRGAGTRIEEQEGDKSITPGALGFAGYAGAFQKGPVGQAVIVTTKKEFVQKYGGVHDASLAPDAALDFFSLANGAGGIVCLRVTDGNEVQAESEVYTRSTGAPVLLGTVKAKNGGRWGGREKVIVADLDDSGDLTNTTLQLPAAIATNYVADEWKDAWIELDAVPNTRYQIIASNATGLLTVASDQTMKDDWTAAAAPTNLRFTTVLEDNGENVSFEIGDGEDSPDSEFSLKIYLDGDLVKTYGNLHTDPTNARYWVNVINNDDSNDWIEVVDSFTGAHTAATRPANFYGTVDAVALNVLTIDLERVSVNAPSGATYAVALGTTSDANNLKDTYTCTMTSATAFDVVSTRFGAIGSGTLAVEFDPVAPTENQFVPPFTITTTGGSPAAGDVIVIDYVPLPPDELIGGQVYPNKGDNKLVSYRIVDNDHKSITVASGVDLSGETSVGKEVMVSDPYALTGGRDGVSALADSDYEAAWDASTSPFNDALVGQNLGLVKFATPGVTSTTVQKAGVAYAAAKNHQYRIEIPSATTTDNGAIEYVNDTVGRSDYSVVSFPSYGYVPDPDPAFAREGRLKLISLTGMAHGREARIAADYQGHHKAEAGIDATLPRLLKLTTTTNGVDRRLDEERLNPTGINVVKKKSGNYVLWGDRTLWTDPNWKWKHQREQMSYYEQVLSENFDWIIFAINDPDTDRLAETALVTFFFPEFTKRALRGDTFQDAAIIKVDAELNTDFTRSQGDLIAEVSLRLADTVERFIIRLGKQGIFEQVA